MLKTGPLIIATAFVVVAFSFAVALNQGIQSAYALAQQPAGVASN